EQNNTLSFRNQILQRRSHGGTGRSGCRSSTMTSRCAAAWSNGSRGRPETASMGRPDRSRGSAGGDEIGDVGVNWPGLELSWAIGALAGVRRGTTMTQAAETSMTGLPLGSWVFSRAHGDSLSILGIAGHEYDGKYGAWQPVKIHGSPQEGMID